MRRIVERCEQVGAYLLADEVYLGAEIHCPRTPQLLGHERPRDRHQRAFQGVRHSRACASAGSSGPPDVVAECWSQHDYLTIGPNKISDAVARVAVRPENREKLYARTRAILQHNLPIMREWVGELRRLPDVPRAAGRRAVPGALPIRHAQLPSCASAFA